MSRYRKKPVEIDAVQFTGSNWLDLYEFTDEQFVPVGQVEPPPDDPDVTAEVWDKLHSTWVGVKDGQWIIRGVQREYYPCDDAVFQQTYEPVGEA